MLIVLIYITRPKQFLEAGAGFPAEASLTSFKGDSQNPRGKEKKRIFFSFCWVVPKSQLVLNIHCCILWIQ